MTSPLTDERLSAYLDGELSGDASAEVEARLSASPEDRARLDAMRVLNTTLQQAFPLEDSVPQHLKDAASGTSGSVVDFASRRMARRPIVWGAMAAAAAGLVIALPLWSPTDQFSPDPPLGAHIAAGPVTLPELNQALSNVVSGSGSDLSQDLRFEAQATFEVADGRVCREFLVMGLPDRGLDHGVACADHPNQGAWDVVVVAALKMQDSENGFVPAGGADQRAIDAMLDALGAGLALSDEDEAAHLE